MGWLYYKIYAKEMANWYYTILNEVVKPFVQQNNVHYDKFFFFNYEEDYVLEPNCAHKFEAGVKVRYIRLRVKAQDDNLGNLEKSLLELIATSQTTLEHEKCEYDVSADLGNRFGLTRTDLAVNYLDAFARMVLSLLATNNQLVNGDKPASAIHLIHNMIGSQIPVACGNVNCRAINQVQLAIPFICRVCGVTTYLS